MTVEDTQAGDLAGTGGRDRAASWRRTAESLWAGGRREMAADLLARACRLDPSDPLLRETAARAQFEAGQVMGARASFSAMLAIDPGDAFARYGLGLCDLELGDRESAERHLSAAVRADPAQPRFARMLAIVRGGSDSGVSGPADDLAGPRLGGRTADEPLFAVLRAADPRPERTPGGEDEVTSEAEAEGRGWLRSADRPLAELFDVALLDLDGTVYLGRRPVPGAPGAVAAARVAGMRPEFVTNNASRTPDELVGVLQGVGVPCRADEVLTSAQVAAQALAARLEQRAPVLVVGGRGLWEALLAVGLRPVDRADVHPAAVVQGWSPDVGWAQLAEAAYALADGATLWVATNLDLTLPTDRGTAPGNGSFVGLLARLLGRRPDVVVGKPEAMLLESAAARAAAARPLVVGDRLDTDVAGGVRAGLPTLLVLSGVTSPQDLLAARSDERPTFVSHDLTGLLVQHSGVRPTPTGWECGPFTAEVAGGILRGGAARSQDGGTPIELLRALCAAAWTASDAGVTWTLEAGLADRLRGDPPG